MDNYKVESFNLDHTKVKAPYLRKCGTYMGAKGDVITKFDIRIAQPNVQEMDSAGIHTLEHLLAEHLRMELNGVIDFSPMGCRTGFYLTMWGDIEPKKIIHNILKAFVRVSFMDEIPAVNEIQCGNYKLHSLELAHNYCIDVIAGGFSICYE